MRAGKLRHRVTIESPYQTRDNIGGTEQAWTNMASRWASIQPLQGRELWEAQAVDARITMRVRFRYLANVTPACRIKFGTRYLNIVSVLNRDERNIELECLCREDV